MTSNKNKKDWYVLKKKTYAVTEGNVSKTIQTMIDSGYIEIAIQDLCFVQTEIVAVDHVQRKVSGPDSDSAEWSSWHYSLQQPGRPLQFADGSRCPAADPGHDEARRWEI